MKDIDRLLLHYVAMGIFKTIYPAEKQGLRDTSDYGVLERAYTLASTVICEDKKIFESVKEDLAGEL